MKRGGKAGEARREREDNKLVAFGHWPIVAHLASIHLGPSSLPIKADLYLLLMPPPTRPAALAGLKVRVGPPPLPPAAACAGRAVACRP